MRVLCSIENVLERGGLGYGARCSQLQCQAQAVGAEPPRPSSTVRRDGVTSTAQDVHRTSSSGIRPLACVMLHSKPCDLAATWAAQTCSLHWHKSRAVLIDCARIDVAAVPHVCAIKQNREHIQLIPCIARAKHPRGPDASKTNAAQTHLRPGNGRGPRAAGAAHREAAEAPENEKNFSRRRHPLRQRRRARGRCQGRQCRLQAISGLPRGAADTEDEPLWKIRIQLDQAGNVGPAHLGRSLRRRGVRELSVALHLRHAVGRREDFAKAATCMILSDRRP